VTFVDENIGFDKPNSCKHVLLLYEEKEAARQIELRYLKNQLQKGQACACLVRSENIDVAKNTLRTELIDNGINVRTLEENGQLRIIPVTDSNIQIYNAKNANEIILTYSEILRSGKKVPTAGFGILPSEEDLIRPERLALQLELEKITRQIFSKASSTWICPYHVDDILDSLDKPWMAELVRSHDGVIYLPRNSNGVALNLT
jgi:hypothetical protein